MIGPGERSKFPLPEALSRTDLERKIAAAYPAEFGRWLASQIRPAILPWPRPEPADPTVSRFGGKPLAPRDWTWPDYYDEPMLFIAQIDCAALQGTAVASLLPPDGLLSFFGDPDLSGGSDFGGGKERGAVFHWPRGTELVMRDPPEPDIEIVPCAGIEFLETLALPHLFSSIVERHAKGGVDDRDFRMRYPERNGIDRMADGTKVSPDNMSQLFGWPRWVQNELYAPDTRAKWRLLLQVGTYDNGVKSRWWGPGGSLYFMIRETDLAARRFDRVEFDAQFS